MTRERAAEILRAHNAWRRGEGPAGEHADPKVIGEAIDFAVQELCGSPPAASAIAAVEPLREFARWALHESSEGLSFDGADVQDKAVELGLLVEVEVEGPCGENCACAEFGDFPTNCYRLSSILAAAKPAGAAAEVPHVPV